MTKIIPCQYTNICSEQYTKLETSWSKCSYNLIRIMFTFASSSECIIVSIKYTVPPIHQPH